MSLVQFLRILWIRKWIIIIAGGACCAAGIVGVLLLPKTYSAEARVMLNLTGTDPVTGEAVNSTFARAYIPTQTELITDYRVSGRVVDRLGWTQSPDLRAEYDASGEKSVDFRRWLARGVSGATTAEALEGSNVIVIKYSAGDPETAAKMADAVRDAYVEETLAFKRDSATKSAIWFENRAQALRANLQAAEARKAEFERANDIILLDDGQDADSARLQSLAGSVDAPQVSTTGGGSPVAGQLAQLDARIAAESQTLGPNHPTILDLRRQRAAIAASAPSAPRTIVTGPSISSQVAGARAKVLAQRGKTEEARRLFADVKVLQDQYNKIQARGSELRQQAASDESGVTLLDSAIPPSTPSSPKIPQIVGGSLVLGLILGLLGALILELLHRRVRGADDLNFDVPLLAVINPAKTLALE